MGDRTTIEWTNATWNPLRGCTRVSDGCRHCYAESVASRFSGPGQAYEGLATRSPARWTGEVRLVEENLELPLRWRKPRRIFVTMSDLFQENVPDEWVDRVFAVMVRATRHTFQVLTKRPERMQAYLTGIADGDRLRFAAALAREFAGDHVGRTQYVVHALKTGNARSVLPLPNVQLGVSVEDQDTADARIPPLLDTPAVVRFVSAEPLLGPVDFAMESEVERAESDAGHLLVPWLGGRLDPEFGRMGGIDQIIVGGESGPGERPCDVEWISSIVRECHASGVPCFVKQLGAHAVCQNAWWDQHEAELAALGLDLTRPCRENAEFMRLPLHDRKGADPSEWPERLRVRQLPEWALAREGGVS